MDMYEYNRQYISGAEDGNEYKYKGIPHIYPQLTPIANMMPGIMPIPMMTLRPGAELEYNRWLSSGYHQPQFHNNPYYDHNSYPGDKHHPHARDRKVHSDEFGDMSPLCGGSNSPRFGPGPPIVTSDRVKGPYGCNLFVFHLPNEITNW